MAKILLIEDDPLMNRLYKKILAVEGFEVIASESGTDGLLRAKEDKPDVILLDIMMPGMDGFEVLEKLKKDEDTKNIQIIILTNLAGEADAKKALEMGAVKYVIKSEYDPNEILQIIKEVLNG